MTVDNNAAFRAALRGTASDLLAYFERRVTLREDAADLLGETMLQAWRRIDVFPEDDKTRQRMWLFGIAANLLANHRRSKRRKLALANRLRDTISTSSVEPDLADANAVRDAVVRLHDTHRELVMLIHWDGLTIVEAAQLLGMNPSTARSRYSAARAILRETLAESIRS